MRKIFAIIAISLCSMFNLLNAGHIKLENTIYSNTIISLPSAAISVTDDRYSALPLSNTASFRNVNVLNQVLLYVDHSYSTPVSTGYDYTVKLEIKRYDKNTTLYTEIKDLHLQYNPNANPGTSYNDKVAYSFSGSHKIEVKILQIKNSVGTTIINPEDNFILKTSIDIERYDKLNRSTTTCISHTFSDGNFDGKDDQITEFSENLT